jgi:hypothetical protein
MSPAEVLAEIAERADAKRAVQAVQVGLIACPTCHAPVEEWCWTRYGRRAPKLHKARLAAETTVRT